MKRKRRRRPAAAREVKMLDERIEQLRREIVREHGPDWLSKVWARVDDNR